MRLVDEGTSESPSAYLCDNGTFKNLSPGNDNPHPASPGRFWVGTEVAALIKPILSREDIGVEAK